MLVNLNVFKISGIVNPDLLAFVAPPSSQYFPAYLEWCGSVCIKYGYIMPKVERSRT